MSMQPTGYGAGSVRVTMMQRRPADPGKIEKPKDPRNAVMRLFAYLKPFTFQMILVLGFVLIYTLLGLAGPYLMSKGIDDGITKHNASVLLYYSVLMLIAYLFNNLFQAIANWIMADVSQRALKLMRRDMFNHMQILPLSFYDRNPAGELMSRLTNDIDAINQAVSQNVTSLIASLLSMGGIIIVMFVLNSRLALVTLLVIPIMLWFTNFVARYTRRGYKDLQLHLGEMNAVMEEFDHR